MCIFDQSYKCFDLSSIEKDRPRLKQLPRVVAQELCLAAILAPLMVTDLAAKTLPRIFATGASDRKGAIVETEVEDDLARVLHRTGVRKGGYHRLQTREEALRTKFDDTHEDEVDTEQDGHCKSHPSKLLALRYHLHRGVWRSWEDNECMSRSGWTCGPVLDLEASKHFDLSSLDVLSWIYFMFEQGRLDQRWHGWQSGWLCWSVSQPRRLGWRLAISTPRTRKSAGCWW